MSLALQWMLVGLIGVAAVVVVLRHFGVGGRRGGGGCPGCKACGTKPAPIVRGADGHPLIDRQVKHPR